MLKNTHLHRHAVAIYAWDIADVPVGGRLKKRLAAIEAGYANRMMLEIAPEMTFGVLSPAFKGGEGGIANA